MSWRQESDLRDPHARAYRGVAGRQRSGMSRAIRRSTRRLLPGLALLLGCTTQQVVPREEFLPGRTLDKTRVYLHDDGEYEFQRAFFRPDTLVGEYEIEVERSTPDGLTYYEKEARVFPIPFSRIDSVATLKRDVNKTLLYTGGIVVLGIVVIGVLDSDASDERKPGDLNIPGGGEP